MTVEELAIQLNGLIESGCADAEVHLRVNAGDRITLRSDLDGVRYEQRVTEVASGTLLLWGVNA